MLELLDRCLDFAGDVVTAIRDDQREAATPCPEFTVRRLTEHLIGGLDWYGRLPAGGPADPRDVPGPDLARQPYPVAFHTATRVIYRNWTPEHLARTYPMPMGEVTGAGITEYTIVEVLCHAWDLATATGQPARPAADLAEAALTMARGIGEQTLRAPNMMGDPVAVSDDASALDRFVAYLGRQPIR
jgi:uncharacterized protein (TIGR03086 family)